MPTTPPITSRRMRCQDWHCGRIADTTLCSTCFLNFCEDTMAGHNHEGEMCEDCGYNTPEGTLMRHCYTCNMETCPEHIDLHTHRDYNTYDDYPTQPRVTGSLHGEASLDLIDHPYRQGSIVHGQRAAALELELEYDPSPAARQIRHVDLPPTVGVGSDGSLTNGIEVTTPPARGLELESVVRTTARALRDAGYEARETCGMHTHIDLRDKVDDTKFMSHLFNALYAVEDILYAMQQENRHHNTYSVPLRNNYSFFDMYGQMSGDFDYRFYKQPKSVEGQRYMNMEKSRKYADVRYAAFNFHSVYFRGSLECRLHEGNSDGDEALRWIDLLQSIIARVEQGHSYKMMKSLAEMKVTRSKVGQFARYFRLRPEQVEYVSRRISTGQGWGFRLPVPIVWGTPVKGRPTGEPRAAGYMRRLYVGSVIRCSRCYREFTLRSYMDYCVGCSYPLIDRYSGRQYTRVSGRRAPRRVNRTIDTSIDQWQWEINLSPRES